VGVQRERDIFQRARREGKMRKFAAIMVLCWVLTAIGLAEVRIKNLGTVGGEGHAVTVRFVTDNGKSELKLEAEDSESDVSSSIFLKKSQVEELRMLMRSGYCGRHKVPVDETWIPGDVSSRNSRAWIEVFKGNAFLGISEGRLTKYVKLTPATYSALDKLLRQGAARL
jgi:hypothetical protein